MIKDILPFLFHEADEAFDLPRALTGEGVLFLPNLLMKNIQLCPKFNSLSNEK